MLIEEWAPMKIAKVSAALYQVPVHRAVQDAIRDFSTLDLVFARVETIDGASGLGFTYSIIPHGGREICSLINNSVDSLVRGMDTFDFERVWYQMWRLMDRSEEHTSELQSLRHL